jgi:hypothetical protein
MENLSYRKEIFERVAADYEWQFKKAVHPTTVHRHFKITIMQFRKDFLTDSKKMTGRRLSMKITDCELDLILQELSHWIAGWEEKPRMTWSEAKARESAAIRLWMEQFETAMLDYSDIGMSIHIDCSSGMIMID